MRLHDLSGLWQCSIAGQSAPVRLPGTLDENGIGHPDTGSNQWHPDAGANSSLMRGSVIATRLTRRFVYEGPASFSRTVAYTPPENARVFLECERSRHLSLQINGQDVPHAVPASVSTPHVFDVTGFLTGHDRVTLICDNRYPGWPKEDIVYSSAATDETQTNWNGILGYIRLRIEDEAFIDSLRVYPRGDTLDICAEVYAPSAAPAAITAASDALAQTAAASVPLRTGMQEVWLRGLPLRRDVRRWDEDEGNLFNLCVRMGESRKTVRFGVRNFGRQDGRLTLNGRRIFLRSEANCAVFPHTGCCPMDKAAWTQILRTYRSYGVNCMRFHSHCPPEAAFDAADELGMLMQPELSHWNPRDAFSSAESRQYYHAELTQILRMLANHPSFVMLTLGNELHMTDEGRAFAAQLLSAARRIDPTRLYASGSNVHYGQRGCDAASDFYTADSHYALPLRAVSNGMRGWLNERYPDFRTDYTAAVRAVHEQSGQPVFSFEVGQFEILPDFDRLTAYRGVTDPANIRLIRDRVAEKGMAPGWNRQVEATGELALLCYRSEIEAALRTEGMSGISLLGLQDFPGQGTALVGMLDPLLEPKPYAFAQPERFRAFFTGVLPMAKLPRMTFTEGETLEAQIVMANYGKEPLCGAPSWSLTGDTVDLHGTLKSAAVPCGGLYALGTLSIPLPAVCVPERLTLTLELCGQINDYSLWVYPDVQPVCPAQVYECRALDGKALDILRRGGTVYLSPPSTAEALPHSIPAQFSTDFWSVGTFPHQAGGMGQLIDAAHPLFDAFPTASHTDWQWWPMACRRAIILPRPMHAIIAEMDSYAYLRPMAKLLECRCCGGRLMISTMGLQDLLSYPEARALLCAVYAYLAGDHPLPDQEMTAEEVRSLIR